MCIPLTKPLEPFIKQVSEVKDLDSLEAVIFWWHKANVVVFYDWYAYETKTLLPLY